MYSMSVPPRLIHRPIYGTSTPARKLCETCAHCNSSISVASTPTTRAGQRILTPQGIRICSQQASPSISTYAYQSPTIHAQMAKQGGSLKIERQLLVPIERPIEQGGVEAGLPSPRFHADSFATNSGPALPASPYWDARGHLSRHNNCRFSSGSPMAPPLQQNCPDNINWGQPRVIEFRSFLSNCSVASPRIAPSTTRRQAPPPPTRSPAPPTKPQVDLPPPAFIHLPSPDALDRPLSMDRSPCNEPKALAELTQENPGHSLIDTLPPRRNGEVLSNIRVESPWRDAMTWRDGAGFMTSRTHGFFGVATSASGLRNINFAVKGGVFGTFEIEPSLEPQGRDERRTCTEMHDQATSYTPPSCSNASDRLCPSSTVEMGCNTSPCLFLKPEEMPSNPVSVELIVHESTTPALRLYDPSLNFHPVGEVSTAEEEHPTVRHISFGALDDAAKPLCLQPDCGALGGASKGETCAVMEVQIPYESALGSDGCEDDRSSSSPTPAQPEAALLQERTAFRGIRLPTRGLEDSPSPPPAPTITGSQSLAQPVRRATTPIGWVPCAAAFADSDEEIGLGSVEAGTSGTGASVSFRAEDKIAKEASACQFGGESSGRKEGHDTILPLPFNRSSEAGEEGKENCAYNFRRQGDSRIPQVMPLTLASKPGNSLVLCSATPAPRTSPRCVFSTRGTSSRALQNLSPLQSMR